MLRLCAIALLVLPLLTAADDPWSKVQNLKSGQEVRVIKRSSRVPVVGAFDELTPDNLILVVKKEQTAIDRNDIDRIDARPANPASRVRRESKSEVKDPDPPRGLPTDARTPTVSSGSNVVIGDKADFETVYRRTAASTAAPRQ